jgi:hypothetical protein
MLAWRVAHAFDLVFHSRFETVGAPFLRFFQGRVRCREDGPPAPTPAEAFTRALTRAVRPVTAQQFQNL